jgi:hypothetical protein
LPPLPRVQISQTPKRPVVIKRFRHLVSENFFEPALDKMGFWAPAGDDITPRLQKNDRPVSSVDFCLFIVFLFSLPFYISVMCVIFKHRKEETLSATFFKFALHLGIIDFLSMLATWLTKFRILGLFYDFFARFDPFLAIFSSYVTWLCLLEQMGATTIIMINRFTCIIYPIQANKVRFLRTDE